jgi:hypothetical protein
MKTTLILTIALFVSRTFVQAQECDIQIQILEDKYMYGQAVKLDSGEELKKTTVTFTSENMEVMLSLEGQNYLISVINEDCQAYCTKAKRVRQLNSGDEKLVINLFKTREKEILEQIRACSI